VGVGADVGMGGSEKNGGYSTSHSSIGTIYR
jgi:hypothetical protein